MKLVKLVGVTDSEVDDILRYTGVLIHSADEVVILEETWEEIVDLFPDVEVKKFEI